MLHTSITKRITSTIFLSLCLLSAAIQPTFAQDATAEQDKQEPAPLTRDKPKAKEFEEYNAPDTPNNDKNENRHDMSTAKLMDIIKQAGSNVEQQSNGSISFTFNDAQLIAVTAEPVNRMRIIAPIIAATDLTQEQMAAILVSNYHLALDARYAVGDGVLYSVFIHPLKELSTEQVLSAIRQVANLRNTFGTSYTSGEMSFGAQRQERLDI